MGVVRGGGVRSRSLTAREGNPLTSTHSILDNGGDIRSDWRKVAKQSARDATGAKSKRDKKRKKDAEMPSATVDVFEQGVALPPPPRLLATKTLLEPWIYSLKKSLDSAKEAKIR